MTKGKKQPSAEETGNLPPICRLKNEDCAGPLQRDHVGYNSVTQQEVFQWLCRYHNCMEARQLRFFVAKAVLGGRALTGPVRIKLNGWHVLYGLHPKLKRRIREHSQECPLPEKFLPGQGQKRADQAVAEGRSIKVKLKPDLRDGTILGFWVQFEGQKPGLVR